MATITTLSNTVVDGLFVGLDNKGNKSSVVVHEKKSGSSNNSQSVDKHFLIIFRPCFLPCSTRRLHNELSALSLICRAIVLSSSALLVSTQKTVEEESRVSHSQECTYTEHKWDVTSHSFESMTTVADWTK